MERCHGKTKAGDRCKRSATEDSLFCGMHASQAEEGPGEVHSADDEAVERGLLDTLFVAVAAGAALAAIFAFRRVFRFG